MGWAGRIGFELLPQPADEDAQILHLLRLRRPPNLTQQLAMGQHLASMRHQMAQQLEFFWGELDRFTGAGDQPARQIDRQVAGDEYRRLALGLESMAQGSAQPRGE